MKVYQEIVKIKTKRIYDRIKLTEKLQEIVRRSKIKNGMLFANALHNTACILIQEDDETIFKDLEKVLERIAPLKEKYEHDYEGNENATAHQKSMILKTFFTVPVIDGKLIKGTWQDFWFLELFEARERKIVVTVIGE